MADVYIGIGSNIDPQKNIESALRLLADKAEITGLSGFYVTPPVGCDSPDFVNGVVRIFSDIEPRELKFGMLRGIEEKLGRVRTPDKYAPRTIDLDILMYGNHVLNEPDLAVPDPDLLARAFVAACVIEIEPDIIVPGIAKPLRDIMSGIGCAEMEPASDFSQRMREEFLR